MTGSRRAVVDAYYLPIMDAQYIYLLHPESTTALAVKTREEADKLLEKEPLLVEASREEMLKACAAWGDMVPPVCGRCYQEDIETFPANCGEKPEDLLGQPIGQYHCPDCGAMVLAGIPHPDLCKLCLERKHPDFDQNSGEKPPTPV